MKLVRRLFSGLLLAGIVAAIAVGYWFWHGRGHAESHEPPRVLVPPPLKVTVAPATLRHVRRSVEVVGTLEGHEEVNIAAKVEGRVRHICKDIGDQVAPGDLLLEIDDTDYRLAEQEAQRGLELELARLGLRELLGDHEIDLKRLPAIARARNLEENANQVLERSRRLGLSRVIAAEDMEKAQTEAKVAQASREQAEIEARATLAAARYRQVQLQMARQRLADTRVIVPCPSASRLPPGITDPNAVRYVVSARKVAEGEMIRTGPNNTTLFRLVIDQPLKLVTPVPERHIAEIRTGQPVELRVEAYPGRTFKGQVARINPTVERISRTFTVEVAVPNEQRQLRAGSFAKAAILVHEADNALTVPEEAVVRFAGVTKVFAVREGKTRAIPVQTGERILVSKGTRRERWIEVIGDLPSGTLVVTSEQSQLADDTPVAIRE